VEPVPSRRLVVPHDLGDVCHLYHRFALGQPIRVSSLSPLGNWRSADNRVSEPPISAGCRPKVSKADIEANEAEFARHFKGAFSIGNVRVRSFPGQPRIPAFCQASQETAEWAGNPRFSRIRLGLWTPALPNLRGKSPKVSGRFRKYSRFGETITGDKFDPDCRPTLALIFGPISGSRRHGIGNLPLGLPHESGSRFRSH
jgi:hypothetical protein